MKHGKSPPFSAKKGILRKDDRMIKKHMIAFGIVKPASLP
jgi:hypothetical protein